MLQLLRDNDITGKIVCVSRWYGGVNLGEARFNNNNNNNIIIIIIIIIYLFKVLKFPSQVQWTLQRYITVHT